MKAVFEKKKWVSITSYCNNSCRFCLDGDINRKRHREKEEVVSEIEKGLLEGCTRLVISGGEATIHPDFAEFISIGKQKGYQKIQVITNGRMFAYDGFLRSAVQAGLDEITFSVHGHKPELHDQLTCVKGSLAQTVKGIRTALKAKLIVSCDIVLNRENVEFFPNIMKFLLGLGVREFDILHAMPYGRAWDNKASMLYDPQEYLEPIRKGLDLGLSNNAVVWTNRLPPEALEGYEKLMQDPIKLLDEIRGRMEQIVCRFSEGKRLECYGERCKYCCMYGLCEFMFDHLEKKHDNSPDEIEITKDNQTRLERYTGSILTLPRPENDYENYEEIIPYLTRENLSDIVRKGNFRIKNVPFCMLDQDLHDRLIDDDIGRSFDMITEDGVYGCARHYIGNKKVKSSRCRECRYDDRCQGIYQKYVMKYGFKVLVPWKL